MRTEVDQLEAAYRSLREALVSGDLTLSEEEGGRLAQILEEQGEGTLEGVRQTEAHTVALSRVVSGIQAIIDGESSKGIARLLRVTDDLAVHASLRWAALVWITWAAKELGAVPLAMETAAGARDLAHTMDMRASATTLGLLGEVEALAGETNQALEYLVQAEELYQSLEDPAGRASVLLLQARLLDEAGRDGYALAKAREALTVAPN